MTTAVLIVYFFVTAPVILWAFWKAWKKTHPAKKEATPLEATVKAAFEKLGIKAEIHELPSTPEETVVQQTRMILQSLEQGKARNEVWFEFMREKANTGKRDSDAIMQSLAAISKVMLENIDKRSVPSKGNVEDFINNLLYARDTFAENATQKKAVEAIISNIKTKHGTAK